MVLKINKLIENSNLVNFFYENRVFQSKDNLKRSAIFLDRDGVISKDKHFISNGKDVELEYGVPSLFKLSNTLNIPIIIITNQSGISRGFFTWEDYMDVTKAMLNKVKVSNTLIAIYANGSGPNAPSFSWRKPSPNMILNASLTLDIDLKKSLIIGDRLSDLIAGLDAGISTLIHIKTGHGLKERDKVKEYFNNINPQNNLEPIFIDNFSNKSLKIIENILKDNCLM